MKIREIRGFYGFAVSKFDGLCPFQVSGFYGFAVSRFQVVGYKPYSKILLYASAFFSSFIGKARELDGIR